MTILTKQRTYVNDKGILGRGLKLPVKREFTPYEKALNMLRTRKRNAEKLLYAVNNPEPKNYAELENYDDFLHALFTGEHLLANSGTSNHFVAENLYTKEKSKPFITKVFHCHVQS